MSSECLSRGGLSGFIATRPVYSTICFLRDRPRPCPDATLLSLSCAAQPQSISIQNARLMGGVQASKNAVNAMSLRIHLRCCPSDITIFRDGRLLETTELFVISAQVSILSVAFDPSPVPPVHPEASPRRRRPGTQFGI